MFNNQWNNKPRVKKEAISKVDRVERAGFIPFLDQIRMLQESGEKLQEYRNTLSNRLREEKGLSPIELEVNPFVGVNVDLQDVHEAKQFASRVLAEEEQILASHRLSEAKKVSKDKVKVEDVEEKSGVPEE